MKEKLNFLIDYTWIYDSVVGNSEQKDQYGKNQHNYKKLITQLQLV